ncbi:MAG: HEAT repeat domain-containing protein [Acidimicrobiia bacterium]|nr:HEAT repeat domain-containing protein [Acidimicrobiia bacterium]
MDADKLVQALAVAWNGVQLYPDPKAVPSFVQAVEAVGGFADVHVTLTIGVDGFEAGGHTTTVENRAADRLAQKLFAERIETLTVVSVPEPDEIIGFFTVLDEEPGGLDLDFPIRLQLAGLTAIQVRAHHLLEDREEEDDPAEDEAAAGRHPDVQALFESGSVHALADQLMEGSPEAAGPQFVDLFRDTYHRVDASDPAGLARVVQTFVDAFFRLDAHYRTVVFGSIMEAHTEEPFRNFLDQLSADELAELGGDTSNAALGLLVEYARVVAEMQGRDPGLVERVLGENEPDARRSVAGTVSTHLANFMKTDAGQSATGESLADQVAALADQPRVGWGVLADLLSIEQRTDRVTRLLRIWVAKLVGAIRTGEFDAASSWLEVLDGTLVDPQLLNGAFNEAATDEVLSILTAGDAEDREVRAGLFEKLSRRAGGRVLEQLASEEDPGRRRALIDIVTEIARVDIRSVLPGLADPRWYVVRNVVIAIGKSGRKAAGEPLARLARHDDHRVRIEALRALLPCLGNGALDHLVAALGDDHVRVRAAASDLLGALEDELVVTALGSALRNETLSVDVRVAVIEALGSRKSDAAREALRAVADSKGRFSSSTRALRAAAREAMRSTNA